MFVLRKLSTGNGDESREFQTKEAAQAVMKEEYESAENEYEDSCICESDATCTDSEAGMYVAWFIYKKPENGDAVSQALVALAMAELGLSKYQIELEDAEDCGRYIADARELLGRSRKNGTNLF